MKMSEVIDAVNHAAENQEKELTLLVEIKASNADLLEKLEAALSGDNVSADLEAAIEHLEAENEKVDERIAELSGTGQSSNTGTGSTGTSGDGTGSGGIAPTPGQGGTEEPASGSTEPASGSTEPASGTEEPPTSGTL